MNTIAITIYCFILSFMVGQFDLMVPNLNIHDLSCFSVSWVTKQRWGSDEYYASPVKTLQLAFCSGTFMKRLARD